MEREFSAGGVLVRNIRGRLMVAAIRPQGKPQGTWALPKGNLDPGESPAETALREVREETGVEGRLVEKLGDVRYTYTRRGGVRVFKNSSVWRPFLAGAVSWYFAGLGKSIVPIVGASLLSVLMPLAAYERQLIRLDQIDAPLRAARDCALSLQASKGLPEGLVSPALGVSQRRGGDETTLRANRLAYGRWTFRPRVLVDVDVVTTGTTVLGAPVSMPLLIAPVAFQGLYNADGELATARAAAAEGVVMCTSTMTSHTHQEIAEAAPGLNQWAQLYVTKDEGATRAHLDDAVAAGCTAIALTVDTPALGRRERDFRAGFTWFPRPTAALRRGELGNVSHNPATHARLFPRR
jgi:hypothetical protein